MRKVYGFILFLAILALVGAVFVQADIQTCKDSYKTTESVSAKSTSQLCINLDKGSEVDLYIIKSKGAVPLDYMLDAPVKIKNSQFSCTKIWESPLAGQYDLFVDCIGNSNYDSLEPFDNFEVSAVAGSVSASVAANNIGNHTWFYDSEEINLDNEMLKISLLAEGEDVVISNMTLSSLGNGNDSEVGKIKIYSDNVLFGETAPAYSSDNGKAVVYLDYFLEKNLPTTFLIVYEMKDTTSEGDYSLTVESIVGIGSSSDKLIKVSGLPVVSGKTLVLSEKTCLGELVSVIDPNPAVKDSQVIVKSTGLISCENKTIVLRQNPCGSSLQDKISSCVVQEGSDGCEISFKADLSRTYHICIDKNNDNDFTDFGEYTLQDMIVYVPEPEVEENITEELNVTEIGLTETNNSITGGIISELTGRISETSSFFILLEITLLMILFVMVMILFRLGAGVVGKAAENHRSTRATKRKAKEEEPEPEKEDEE